MGAIHHLLERWGFVKLDRYGLLLTPDGRILSSRPAVLDDGLGGRIVGWQDGDLAAMELQRWEPARPAPKQATASRLAVATAPTVPAPARPPVPQAARAIAPAAPAPVPAKIAAPAVVTAPAPVVAAPTPPPVVDEAVEEAQDEDEWEWTITLARARAAAEEAERAAAAPKFLPVVRTAPIAVVAQARTPVAPSKPAVPPPLPPPDEVTQTGPAVAVQPAAMPRTIIPVPQLPRVTDPSLVRPATIARGTGPQFAPPLRRVPRSTDRIEDTVRTSAAPANDDKTSPGIALPPAGGGRRVAAKQR